MPIPILIWASPLWYVLTPIACLWLISSRYAEFKQAQRPSLADRKSFRQLQIALLASAIYIAACLTLIVYETSLWAIAVGSFALIAAGLSLRASRTGIHPGIKGFHLLLPQDGLAFTERHVSRAVLRRAWIRQYARIFPLFVFLTFGFIGQPQRWWLWICLALSTTAPLFLIPYKRAWIGIYGLSLAIIVLGWNAVSVRAFLPPGRWTTPWFAAQCSNQVFPLGDGTAWCFSRGVKYINHFDLSLGYLVDSQIVEDSDITLFLANRTPQIAYSASLRRVQGASTGALDQDIFQDAGLRGPMTDLGQAADGTIWVLQRQVFNPLQNRGWWLSARRPNGDWWHLDLSRLTGMRPTRDQNAMAVDATGRVWFTAVDPLRREKFLGILNPDGSLAYSLFSLGMDPLTGPYFYREARPHLHGVVSDGYGGVYLYNRESEPLRHWQP